MPVCVFKVEFFFSFPGITRGYSTCHVPSLLPAGSHSSSSWRLQRTQTSTDSSINWFADISLWKKTTSLSSSCGLRQGHKFMQSLLRYPMLAMAAALAPITPRAKWKHTAWNAIESQLRALHRHDFLLHSSSASMSSPCDITSSVWASELPEIDPRPLWISVFFGNVYSWSEASVSVRNEMKPKLQDNKLSRLIENTFSLEISSSLNLIISLLCLPPPLSPLPVSPQPLHVITRVVSAQNSGEGEVHQQMAP